MRVPVLNESHLDDATVGALVAFAADHIEFATLTYIHVRTKDRKVVSATDGRAFKRDPTPHGDAFFAPSRVEVDLVDRRKHRKPFPLVSWHPVVPDAVGRVVLCSAEEEFLFTLAHELRHIDQFWNDAEVDEADAEKFALKVLLNFRKLLDRAVAA
jgi:hypothetical protein